MTPLCRLTLLTFFIKEEEICLRTFDERKILLITIISGSPREGSKSLEFAGELFEKEIQENPENEVSLISISDMEIDGCHDCRKCKETFECVIEDDVPDILDYVKKSDELVVVTPIYMAGVPSQLKALLDRFQPMFWEGARHAKKLKPAKAHLFGEGHDPYGTDGAILTLKSALHVAGFEVTEVEEHIN